MDGIGKPANVNVNLDLLGSQHNANVIVDLRTDSKAPMVNAAYSGDNFVMNLPSSLFGSAPGVPSINSKSKLNIVAKVYEDDVFEGEDKVTWTKNYLLRKWNWSACEYEIRVVDGKEYMIIEWKSGDYRFGGYDTNYYVFIRA